LQQVDYRTERRGLRADGSGPLPQFDLAAWDAFDPDRTLERLPALPADILTSAPPPVAPPPAAAAPAAAADAAATAEIVAELSSADLVEERELAVPESVPIVLAQPRAVPVDLDRLLARARAEASRSPEYFRAPTPTPPPTVVDWAPVAASGGRADSTAALPLLNQRPKRRLGWVVGTVAAVAGMTLVIALGQSRVSSARSPRGGTVTKPVAPSPAVARASAGPARSDAPFIPATSIQNLPRVETGTISLAAVAASHRLFIDGKVAEGGTAVVSCGTHAVQVGSQGVRRYVTVPCGQEIILAK